MFGRRRPLLRAAAVGGGAYLAGRYLAHRQAAGAQVEADQDAGTRQLGQHQDQSRPPHDRPQAAASPTSPMVDQLNQLADLHLKGILTDDEFAAAKGRVFAA